MALTLGEATEMRESFRKAILAVSTGQSYTIGTRSLTRANLPELKKAFAEYDQLVDQLSGGKAPGIPVRRFMPRDL